MKKQKRQLPKHVSKNQKAVKIDGEQVFFPGFGGFGVPFAGVGVGAGIGVTPFGPVAGFGVGAGLGLGFGGFGYYGGWL